MSSSPSRTKYRIEEMEEKIECYSKFLDTVPDDERPHLQTKLLSAKLMKKKLIAMTALAKAQTILAEMDVLIAESNLNAAVDQLDQFKKDHSVAAEKKRSCHKPEEIITKAQKEAIKIQGIASKPAALRKDNDKENTSKSAVTNHKKSSAVSTKGQKLQKSRSSTPIEKTNKRRHSSPSRSKSQNCEKIPKKRQASTVKNSKDKTMVTDKSTLMSSSMSPISKTKSSSLVSQGVQTSNTWLEPVTTCSDRKQHENVAQRKIQDTLFIETLPNEGSITHRDAIHLSQVLEQIMLPKGTSGADKTKDSGKVDLSQSPMVSKIQHLFEDQPKKCKTKCPNEKVKMEPQRDTRNTSTDNLVNDLYKDIMEAKIREQGLTSVSTNSWSSAVFSKSVLREILDKY